MAGDLGRALSERETRRSLAIELVHGFAGGGRLDVSCTIEFDAAPVTVLFGPSGSGKTTLLRYVAGLFRPDQGRLSFCDEHWVDVERRVFVPPQARKIGLLAQDNALFPHLTVEQNVGFGLRRLPKEDRGRRVQSMLELLRVEKLADRLPVRLSGGEQQRVALARALVTEPRLLLLDEPLSALDAPTREELRSALRKLLKSLQIPTLLVTHDRVEALALGDRVAVVAEGRVRQLGGVAEVFSNPADLLVARTVGVETVLPAFIVRVADGLATVRVGEVELLALAHETVSGEAMVCIRGEDVVLEQSTSPRTSARNQLAGRIISIVHEGPLMRVALDCGLPLVALVTRAACDELGLQEGGSVVAAIKAPAIRLVSRDAS